MAAAVPVFDDDLVGRRCVVRVVDFDYQVVAGTAYEQVTRHNARAKHELVRLAVAVVVVVADDVLTVAPVEQVGVGATAAFDAVVAGASRERIGSIAVRILRFDDVITATPVDGVASSGTKGDRVVAFSTQQRVGTAATIGNDVVPSTAVDGVAAVAVGDSVVAAVAIYHVVPCISKDHIIRIGAEQFITSIRTQKLNI